MIAPGGRGGGGGGRESWGQREWRTARNEFERQDEFFPHPLTSAPPCVGIKRIAPNQGPACEDLRA